MANTSQQQSPTNDATSKSSTKTTRKVWHSRRRNRREQMKARGALGTSVGEPQGNNQRGGQTSPSTTAAALAASISATAGPTADDLRENSHIYDLIADPSRAPRYSCKDETPRRTLAHRRHGDNSHPPPFDMISRGHEPAEEDGTVFVARLVCSDEPLFLPVSHWKRPTSIMTATLPYPRTYPPPAHPIVAVTGSVDSCAMLTESVSSTTLSDHRLGAHTLSEVHTSPNTGSSGADLAKADPHSKISISRAQRGTLLRRHSVPETEMRIMSFEYVEESGLLEGIHQAYQEDKAGLVEELDRAFQT